LTIHGIRKVSKDIVAVYAKPENLEKLEQGVANVLEEMVDLPYVNEQLSTLLWQDTTISYAMRMELSEDNDSLEHFISKCILFGMSRTFISRDPSKKTAKKKSFLLSDYLLDYHFPSLNSVFYGREDDLSAIHQKLSETPCLFLEGIGGIGKSELAKQFGKRYEEEYDNVLFIRYAGNLRKTITRLEFIDDKKDMSDDTLFQNHYRFFKQLPTDTLVILDNFDTVPEKDDLFHEFLSLSFQLLVTTRCHIDEVSTHSVTELESMDELSELFYAYAPITRDKPLIVADIIQEVYRHTLTVEMAAKTLTAADLTPEMLLAALQKEGLALSEPIKVKVKKDSSTKKKKLYEHIQTLFTLQNLSEHNLYILRHMVLIPLYGIPKRLFQEWMKIQNLNYVNSLIDYGWIQQDMANNRISLHPFLHEVIASFSKPKFSTCGAFLTSIYTTCFRYGEDIPYYRDLLSTIESIFQEIEIDDTASAYHFFSESLGYCGKYHQWSRAEKLLDIMKDSIPMEGIHKREKATYELYRGLVSGGGKADFKAGLMHLKRGLEIIQPISKEYAGLATHFYSNLSNFYAVLGDRKSQIASAERALLLRKEYCMPENLDSFTQRGNLAIAYIMNNEHEKGDKMVDKLDKWAKTAPNFGMTLGEFYSGVGFAKLSSQPCIARDYFLKAKQSYAAHLPPKDETMMMLNFLLQQGDLALAMKKIGMTF